MNMRWQDTLSWKPVSKTASLHPFSWVQRSDKIRECIIKPHCIEAHHRVTLLITLEPLRWSDVTVWTVQSGACGSDLCQKEEENLVVGEDGVRGDAQQEVLKADSPSLYKVWVQVVCRQLVPHKLRLQEPQLHMHEHVISDDFIESFSMKKCNFFANSSIY